MAHHSPQQLPQELQEQLLESLNKMADTAEQYKLGPTGKFPEGKLTDNDEGEIQIAITQTDGKVVLNLGTPVAWLGFTPEQAEQIAYSLIENAGKAKKPSPYK